MVRQYIGARYVPKFFENSRGGTEWESGVAYEPLTIVTYNSNSYTSRKAVPATTGNPSDNPEFWASTGIYNQQVESYRQLVESYKTEVDEVIPRVNSSSPLFAGKTVVYGDSTTTVAGNYVDALISKYALDITNRGVSGTILRDTLSTIAAATDLATFKNIILAFGVNDWQGGETLSSVRGAYEEAFSTILGKAPEITIICITPFWSYHKFGDSPANVNPRGYTLKDYVDVIKEICGRHGVKVIDFYNTSGCNVYNYRTLLVPSYSDPSVYVHEGAAFGEKLADLILNSSYGEFSSTPNRRNWFNCLSFGAALLPYKQITQLPNYARGGLSFAFSGEIAYDSLLQYFSADRYTISGYSTAAGTITILKGIAKEEFATYSIRAGLFKITFTADAPGAWYIRFTMTNSAYIGNLELYSETNDDSGINLYHRGYGLTRNSENVREGAIIPNVKATGYEIINSSGYFTANRLLTEGDVLFTSNELYFPTRILIPTNLLFTGNDSHEYEVFLSFYQNTVTLAEGKILSGQGCRIFGNTQLLPPY